MATTGKPAAAAALLVLLAVALIAPASASTLTVFSGPGCSGRSKDVNGCGCFDLTGYQSGFHFVFTEEQEAVLYTDRHCRNSYRTKFLDEETRYCRRFPFRSVEMVC
ncbi:unnamed protein product [Spirodela intermedia]|uniref:Uncharacterized protein n=2 Tax=Spirodela intermedia TaxID=51605 RepID=A0A7I8JGV5_SPIIN|nr:unnamed protein product [Spirodela intermedia]CAA6668632.1 unnamed protein product [Spirodela intermedia]CAA7405511.1 unnamed protein product [Spirodela intermedia]